MENLGTANKEIVTTSIAMSDALSTQLAQMSNPAMYARFKNEFLVEPKSELFFESESKPQRVNSKGA